MSMLWASETGNRCASAGRTAEVVIADTAFPPSGRGASAGMTPRTYPSSTSRTVRVSVSGVKGFWRNAMRAVDTPRRTISSSVYPEM